MLLRLDLGVFGVSVVTPPPHTRAKIPGYAFVALYRPSRLLLFGSDQVLIPCISLTRFVLVLVLLPLVGATATSSKTPKAKAWSFQIRPE